MLQPLRKHAALSDRARPKSFWRRQGLMILAGGLLRVLAKVAGPGSPVALGLIGCEVLLILGSVVPAIAACVRRLHQLDRTGWWMLLAILPIIGPLIVMSMMDGPPGPKRFGQSPKAPIGTVLQ
mgnify:CR=1 FL=1